MLASMAEIVGGSPDLNAERQHLATLIDHCRSWESELATKEADRRELCISPVVSAACWNSGSRTVSAELPEEIERHSRCLLAGQSGPSAPISLLSNEGMCVQCTSTIDGPALCRRGL